MLVRSIHMPEAYMPHDKLGDKEYKNCLRLLLDVAAQGLMLSDKGRRIVNSIAKSIVRWPEPYRKEATTVLKQMEKSNRVKYLANIEPSDDSICTLAAELATQFDVEVVLGDVNCSAIQLSPYPKTQVFNPWEYREVCDARLAVRGDDDLPVRLGEAAARVAKRVLYPALVHTTSLEILDRNIGRLGYKTIREKWLNRGNQPDLQRYLDRCRRDGPQRLYDFYPKNYDKTLNWLFYYLCGIHRNNPLEVKILTEISGIYTDMEGRVLDSKEGLEVMIYALKWFCLNKEEFWNSKNGIDVKFILKVGFENGPQLDHDRHWRTDHTKFVSSRGMDMFTSNSKKGENKTRRNTYTRKREGEFELVDGVDGIGIRRTNVRNVVDEAFSEGYSLIDAEVENVDLIMGTVVRGYQMIN